jgi:hypothetical protein
MQYDKRARGRPTIPAEERLEQRSIRLTAAQWAKIDANGGMPWLRAVIQRAKGTAASPADTTGSGHRKKTST